MDKLKRYIVCTPSVSLILCATGRCCWCVIELLLTSLSPSPPHLLLPLSSPLFSPPLLSSSPLPHYLSSSLSLHYHLSTIFPLFSTIFSLSLHWGIGKGTGERRGRRKRRKREEGRDRRECHSIIATFSLKVTFILSRAGPSLA
jgi:hypothetical protein